MDATTFVVVVLVVDVVVIAISGEYNVADGIIFDV